MIVANIFAEIRNLVLGPVLRLSLALGGPDFGVVESSNVFQEFGATGRE